VRQERERERERERGSIGIILLFSGGEEKDGERERERYTKNYFCVILLLNYVFCCFSTYIYKIFQKTKTPSYYL